MRSGTRMERALFFSKGIHRIDYIFAFKLLESSPQNDIFNWLLNLSQHGVDIEIEDASGKDPVRFNEGTTFQDLMKDKLIFAKLHVQWSKLLQIAELLHFQKPIKFGNQVVYDSFSISRRTSFTGFLDNSDTFFTPTERILAVEYILNQVNLQTTDEDTPLLSSTVNVKLVKKGHILTLFPLHEPEISPTRRVLIKNWASLRKICDSQPYDAIREYFGEKCGLFFAWHEFYLRSFLAMFLVSSLASLIPTFLTNRPLSIENEVCSENSARFLMCPTCIGKGCRFTDLKSVCEDLRWKYMYENPASVLVAFISPIIATMSLRLWIYRQQEIAYKWHMGKYKSTDESRRFQYLMRSKKMRQDTSGKTKLFFWKYRVPLKGITILTTVTLLSLTVVLEVVSYLVAEGLSDMLRQFSYDFISQSALFVAFGISQIFNGVCTCILSKLYGVWVSWSVALECHRTHELHERSTLIQNAFMEFINMYLPVVVGIIAQGLRFGYPGQGTSLFGPPKWPIWSGVFDIHYGVFIRCTTILFIKSVDARTIASWLKRKSKKETPDSDSSQSYKFYLQNYNLEEPMEFPLFRQQLNMCVFIGFATLFLPASFVWIFSLTLISILTQRGYALKLTRKLRRLSPMRARSIGNWMSLLNGICVLSIPTNACLIAFASEFVNKLVYKLHYSADGSMIGYTHFSLSYMNVTDFEISEEDKEFLRGARFCRYFGYREPPSSATPYALTSVFWHIFAAKLLFIVIFVMAVLLVNWAVVCLIPKVPRSIATPMKTEGDIINAIIVCENMNFLCGSNIFSMSEGEPLRNSS